MHSENCPERICTSAHFLRRIQKPEEIDMRKVLASVIALAVLGIAAPIAATTSASARETVIIKKDRGHHYGWYKHRHERAYGRDRDRHHHRGAKVIINR
jgi:hypothetical protein